MKKCMPRVFNQIDIIYNILFKNCIIFEIFFITKSYLEYQLYNTSFYLCYILNTDLLNNNPNVYLISPCTYNHIRMYSRSQKNLSATSLLSFTMVSITLRWRVHDLANHTRHHHISVSYALYDAGDTPQLCPASCTHQTTAPAP